MTKQRSSGKASGVFLEGFLLQLGPLCSDRMSMPTADEGVLLHVPALVGGYLRDMVVTVS